MNSQQQAKFQTDMRDAHQSLSNGDTQRAIAKFGRLLKQWPKQPQIHHFLGLAYKAVGDTDEALKYLKTALSISDKQPEVHNNLANLYKALKNFELAEQHYLKAIRQKPDYLEAKRNFGLCLADRGEHLKAVQQFELVIAQNGGDVVTLTALANAERELGQYEAAAGHYSQALNINPKYANAWHNCGVNYHLQGSPEKALEHYTRALQLNPNQPEIVESCAMTLYETGAKSAAIELFEHWLSKEPLDVRSHERLNELIWESDRQKFGSSFRQVLDANPESVSVRNSYIKQLLKAGLIDQAAGQIELANHQYDSDPEFIALQGRVLAESKDYDLAHQKFSQSLAFNFSPEVVYQQVKLCLLTERYEQGQKLVNSLLEFNSDCQLSWAYQSLLWRLTDNEKYSWLCDYQKYVCDYQLAVPNGYANLEEFLQSVEACLVGLHKSENAPLQQTLRNGTQTAARLFYRNEPEINALVTSLTDIVQSYISNLSVDERHPLLRRKAEQFHFSGSWSVKLEPNGFHVNHVHPAGWISSSCYISIPNVMNLGGDDNEGAIKFGESPLQLESREVIERTIMPKAGMVVLFPSYMWHGTIPFSGKSGEFRLTSPFDVSPNSL